MSGRKKGTLVARLRVQHGGGGALNTTMTLSRPKRVGAFEIDARGNFHSSTEIQPPRFSRCKVGADLNEGFAGSIQESGGEKEGGNIGHVLQCLERNRYQVYRTEENSSGSGNVVDFITYRNNLNKIMGTIYNSQDPWEIGVIRHKGVYQLDIRKHLKFVDEINSSSMDAEKLARFEYYGYKFEQLSTLPSRVRSDVPVDSKESHLPSKEEYCVVLQTRLGTHKIILAAEIDCKDFETGEYVELKTSAVIERPNQYYWFEKKKLLKYWIQSYLAGVEKIVVGFRDRRGIICELTDFDTQQLPKLARQKKLWDSNACLEFTHDVLSFIRQHVNEDDVPFCACYSPLTKEIYLYTD